MTEEEGGEEIKVPKWYKRYKTQVSAEINCYDTRKGGTVTLSYIVDIKHESLEKVLLVLETLKKAAEEADEIETKEPEHGESDA